MHVNKTDVERSSASAQIQIPHADKRIVFPLAHGIMNLLEIFIPAHKRLIIMAAQAFYILYAKVVVISM